MQKRKKHYNLIFKIYLLCIYYCGVPQNIFYLLLIANEICDLKANHLFIHVSTVFFNLKSVLLSLSFILRNTWSNLSGNLGSIYFDPHLSHSLAIIVLVGSDGNWYLKHLESTTGKQQQFEWSEQPIKFFQNWCDLVWIPTLSSL